MSQNKEAKQTNAKKYTSQYPVYVKLWFLTWSLRLFPSCKILKVASTILMRPVASLLYFSNFYCYSNGKQNLSVLDPKFCWAYTLQDFT